MTDQKRSGGLSRRQFFRSFVAETVAGVDEVRGIPQLRINELENKTQYELKKLVPRLTSGCKYGIEGNRLMLQDPDSRNYHELCALDPQDRFIMRQFDGAHQLDAIAEELGQIYNLEPNQAFEKVKRIFILFAKHQLCAPVSI